MRAASGLLVLLLAASPSISYFQYQRKLQPPSTTGQHYTVVDEVVWQHARQDLRDLRLYSDNKEIPHKISIERGSTETEQKECRVLQPGTVGGKTQFLVDMSGVPEYDHIELHLAARNFVSRARVEGQDDLHGAKWAVLGTTTLFDLADEHLGRNITLQIPVATYKYLRVTVDPSIKPSDVESATAGIKRAQEAVWRNLPGEPTIKQRGRDTVLAFLVPENSPVERVNIYVDVSQRNFLRGIEIRDSQGLPLGSGELGRIHMQRNGQNIDTAQTWLDLRGKTQGTLEAIIHNGDDAPLRITGARLQQYERRIYFDSDAGGLTTLYYGDEKLDAPVYDYAKLFRRDAGATLVSMGGEEANTIYTGRPDDRPWSERHPALLWAALVAAVLVLGGIAVRSMKTRTS